MIKFFNRLNIFSGKALFYTINIFILFFIGGVLYFYFSPKVYSSYTSLQIGDKDIQTEIDLLKSRRILEKAVDKIGMDTDYFTKRFFIKKRDVWGEVPFKAEGVKSFGFYEKEIKIIPIDNEKFYLSLENSLSGKSDFKKMFYFSKEVKTPYFSFVLKKTLPIEGGKSFYLVLHKKDVLINRLKKRIYINSSKNSSLIKIRYFDTNPKKVKEFLDALVESYMEEKNAKENEKISKISQFLDKRLRKAKENLDRSLKELKKYKDTHKIYPQRFSPDVMNLFIGYKEELRKIALELNTLSMVKNEIKKGNYSMVKAFEKRYPEIASLAEKIEKLSFEKKSLSEKVGELSPETILLGDKIDKLKKSMEFLIENIRKSLYRQKASIEKNLGKKNEEVKNMPEKEREFFDLEQNYRVAKSYYDYLLKEKSSLLVNGVSKDLDIFVVDKARESDFAVKPKFFRVLTSSMAGAFLFSLFVAFLVNEEDKVVKSPQEIKKMSSLPVYGIIPYVNDHRLYNKIYVIEKPSIVQSEAFRNIRTNIEYIKGSKKCKTLTVTSTIPGEGKSVIVANLASILGMGDKKTLLLCADLRTSEMHKKFSISNEKGLSDVLRGRAKVREAMQSFKKIPNLKIIPSGSEVKNPYDLLESKSMEILMKNLQEYFDYIVIETPPIDLVSDAFIMSKYSDMTIFVLKSEYSKKEFVKRADEMAKKYEIKNAGFVIHSVKEKYLNKVSYNKEYLFHKNIS